MFYYRISVKRRETRQHHRQDRRIVTEVSYREYGGPREVGEFVAHSFGQGCRSVTVTKINQAAFMRATRRD